MKFVGRTQELKQVQDVIRSRKAELFILYGRRRLGKSTLLRKVLLDNKQGFYFQFFEESLQKNLSYFKEELATYFQNDLYRGISSVSWYHYFSLIANSIPKQSVFVFDEFSYIVAQDVAIVSHFQRIYDEILKPKQCKLILCGSSTSIMSDLIDYKSPLYGRRTGSMELQPFSMAEVAQLLLHVKDKQELLQYMSIFGGIPYYLEQIDQSRSFIENFTTFFFDQKGFFHDEVKFLLKEEVREVRNYFAILKSIGYGKHRYTDIEQDAMIERSSLSKYLFVLEQIGYIQHQKSFFDKQHTKNRRYIITDFFLYFWFSVFGREVGNFQDKQVQKRIVNQNLQKYFGLAFERICMQSLSKHYEKIGTFFRGVEIDIVAQKGKGIDVFECKFSHNVHKERIYKELDEKIQYLPPEFSYKKHIICLDDIDFLFSLQ